MVFGVGQFNYASHIWLRQTLAMATKICDFQQKIGYNSACAGDTPQILAPTRGFWGSANRGVATGVDIGIYTPKNQPK